MISASSSASSVFSHLGCHIGMSKYFTRKGHTTLSSTRYRRYLVQKMQHGISDELHLITIRDIRYLPKGGCLLCYPVLAAALGCEKNYRRAVPFMGRKGAIETSHIRQCIVDIGIVMVGGVEWTRLGIVFFATMGKPDLLFLVLRWLAI